MNRRNRMIRIVAVVIMLCLFVTTPVLAGGISTNFPAATGSVNTVNDSARKVWGSVITVVQILAFAAVVFAGLRYMFASADQKADIKKGLGMLAIGAILVFAASTVVQFVVKAADEII